MSIRRSIIACALPGAALVLTASAPSLSDVPARAGVQEPFFAMFLGVVHADLQGSWSGEEFRAVVESRGRPTRIPLEALHRFSRTEHARARSLLRLDLAEDVDIPFPYTILGYHPGTIRVSRVFEIQEWRTADIRFQAPPAEEGAKPVWIELTDVIAFGITQGHFEVDVDGWLDALMGERLDDNNMIGFATFIHDGRLLGMSLGYARGGRASTGIFDFARDEVVFPVSPELTLAGRYMLARIERHIPELRTRGRSE